ncbi:acyl-CoA dehydrogenase [Baekduia soli]|uniref:Acyl-CoA dehydrogenase n=1 Tax=Baekduia soli TaxID=496014 RepID=A0A5B8U278_9ACTN|nr:acyl-CoA dehydrogenase family protein [Baekduia soli]QEC47058.1 acyl-CoA dehydrogenase [Baekduia soli]
MTVRPITRDLQLPLSWEETVLREEAERWLARQPPTARARAAMERDDPFDPAVWAELAEMGWLGLLVPEAAGGAGGSVLDAALLMEAMGAALLPDPYLSTAVLGAVALRATQPDPLAALAAGTLRVAVSLGEGPVVTRDGGAPRATGSAAGVVGAVGADLLVLAAADEHGDALLVTAGPAAGGVARLVAEAALDPARPASTVVLDGPVELLAAGDEARAVVEEVVTVGAIAIAAELTGGAAHCLAETVAYAGTRTQFGRPIGAYQAVKHRCVDLLLEVEAARAAVRQAARLADAGAPDAPVLARAALLQASTAGIAAGEAAIQLHGGAGFTWEHDAHLYLRRARAAARMLGAGWRYRQSIALALGL